MDLGRDGSDRFEAALRLGTLLFTLACPAPRAQAPDEADVLTNRYNPARTGAQRFEWRLTPKTVDPGQFGKLFAYPVSGNVYAQPRGNYCPFVGFGLQFS